MTEQEMIDRIKYLEEANAAFVKLCKKSIKMLSPQQTRKILPEIMEVFTKYEEMR